MRTIIRLLFGDTLPTRFTLALAAAIWTVILAAPGDNLVGTPYGRMLWIAPENVWTALFALYGASMWYWIVHSGQRPRAELVVHTFGVLLFSTTATAAILNGDGFLGYAAPQLTLAASALWVFARSAECPGRNRVRDV